MVARRRADQLANLLEHEDQKLKLIAPSLHPVPYHRVHVLRESKHGQVLPDFSLELVHVDDDLDRENAQQSDSIDLRTEQDT